MPPAAESQLQLWSARLDLAQKRLVHGCAYLEDGALVSLLELRGERRDSFHRKALFAILSASALAGCLSFGTPPGLLSGTAAERVELFSRLLVMEDRRFYDPLLSRRAASSPDPWIRAKTALATGRLHDPSATLFLPVLLRDPDPAVRRAAAFAAGLTNDRRLIRFLRAAMDDTDLETASHAAEAIGKLGGEEAISTLLGQLDAAKGPRSSAARALFRFPEVRVLTRLSLVSDDPDPLFRRALWFAVARRPLPEAKELLRRSLSDPDPTVASTVARALGLLADKESVPELVRSCRRPESSVVIQSLLALEKIGVETPLHEEVRDTALQRSVDPRPGIAISALKLLGRVPGDTRVAERLDAAVEKGGRSGGIALQSLIRIDSAAAGKRLSRALDEGSLEARLAAAEIVFLLPAGQSSALATRLLHDPSARVRALLVGEVPKEKESAFDALLSDALHDQDAAVRSAALESLAPRLDRLPSPVGLERAWLDAFGRAFRESEPDFTVGALDAAALWKAGGRSLIEKRTNDPDAVVREKSRRLLVEKFGVPPSQFLPVKVKTRLSDEEYRRVARGAIETLLTAHVRTTRGSFDIELNPEEAPLTVDNFVSLARRHFFDGITIHRVVPDFVVQAGDPRGDGSGGPGYAIRDEINPLRYERGAVGMALSGADTGGSQWFVTLSPQPHLDGGYTVFGKTFQDEASLDLIEQDDTLLAVTIRERPRPEAPRGAIR